MPVVLRQLIPANAAQAGYAVAKELARQTVAQFGAVRGAGVGIGGGSCCAAVAVVPGGGYLAANGLTGFGGGGAPVYGGGGLPYAIVYGNSQIGPGGLAAVPVTSHAERCALVAAGAAGRALYVAGGQAVLFVELTPCAGCQTWLGGGGGGAANPYNAAIAGGTTLNVWWRWAYPGDGGVAAMNTFHGWGLAAQLADINANW